MIKIEYEIKLNENGRPYVHLPKEYEDKPEDKFFVMELTRLLLQNVYINKSSEFQTIESEKLEDTITVLAQISDEIAAILYEQMKSQGEMMMMLNMTNHIQVNSIELRDALPDKDIVYEDKIFYRVEGLRVAVKHYDETYFTPIIDIYELVDGITNENWKKL